MTTTTSDATLDLRALEQVLMRRVEQEVQIIRSLPMSSGAWQREKAHARKDAYDTALMDVRHMLNTRRGR